MKREVVLETWPQAREILTNLAQWLRPRLDEHKRYAITIAEPTRTTDQNARLHAMLSDIAKQVEWGGKRRSVDVWKRLCVAAWLRAEGEPVEILPAIDGVGVDIVFERTSRMTKAQMSSLMEYVSAWGCDHGVEWSEPRGR